MGYHKGTDNTEAKILGVSSETGFKVTDTKKKNSEIQVCDDFEIQGLISVASVSLWLFLGCGHRPQYLFV